MPDWMRDRYDTMEVLDAVLSVVGGNPRPRDMVVDYAKRLREQSRDMDEYYADEAAGARGFADAGEMDAYDNMREREATGFHDVAAAGREADGARADLLADARARLNDPNASEFDKQAARAVLRFRQRDGRGGASPYETTEGDGVRYRFTGSREDFDKMRDEAVKRNGLVMPGLADKQVRIVAGDSKIPFDVSLRDTALKNQVKSYAREHADEILGDVEVEGGIVNVSLTSIGEMADPKSYKNTLKNGISKEIHFAVIPKIKEIIGNSIDAEVHPDYLDRDASGMRITGRYSDHILMHRLYGAVEIDGQVYRVKTTVKEDKTNNTNRTHTYEVAEIELLESHTRPADSTSPISNNSISGANLLQDVRKSYDSGKLLLDESAKTTESGGISQGFGSAATSLNQVASAMRKIDWKPGTVNVDIGGGRFDKATEYLREQGVESMVFDPFNRDAEHNRQVAERVRDEKVDTVTCNNVLNVIDSASSRANVILQAAKALKPGGTAYFSVYEGDKSGVGRQTKSDSWQNNRVTKDYVSEIERYFDDVTVKDKVIIAKNPKATAEQSVWDFDGTYSGNDVRFRFVGERGAGRQDAADGGERMRNKEIAEAMERGGKDARSIKLATGWERGKDGKWRHEEGDNLLDLHYADDIQPGDSMPLYELLPLGEDNRLFEAYPELKGVTVEFRDLGDSTKGSYNEGARTISISNLLLPSRMGLVGSKVSALEELNKTLLHEQQHAIQAMEGFAKGGNPWMQQSEVGLHDSERYSQVTRELITVWERLNELDRMIEKLWNHYDRIPWRGGSEERKRVNAQLRPLERERIELIDRRNDLMRERKELADMPIGYDTYNALAGEVEARNVSERMDMTDEQRRQSLAADTEDVARDEQIVRFGNGVSMDEVKDDILDYFHKAARGEVSGHGKSIGKLTKDGKVFLEQVSGLTLKDDIDFVLNPSDLRHIYHEHYGSNEKDPGNNKPLTDDDIRNIAAVSTQPERVVFGINKKTGNKVFIFLSSNPDGTYNLAEVYTDRRGNLTAKSFYNTKKTISQRVNELLTSSPRLTSATEGASSSSGAKVPKLFEPLQENGEKKSETTVNSGVLYRVRDGHEAAVEDARRRLESGDASEFERQAAMAVIKAYGGGSDDAPDTPGGGVRFRTRDDADMLVDTAKLRNEVARQRRDAVTDFVKAITDVDELTDSKFATALGKVMRGQRQYDQDTVADITTMVKAMMDAGLLTELDNFSVKQILTKVKDSTGKNDITAEANKLIDIMLKHQLRRGKRAFEQQLKVKGMRQDSRGVVVQNIKDY